MKETEISNGGKKIFPIIFLSLLFFLVFTPIQSQSQGLVPCDMTGPNACTLCDLFTMFDRIIDFLLFRIVPSLAVLMIAIGGGMYIISQGNPEMLGRVKKLFTAVVIGLIIIYGAWLIVSLFLTVIGVTVWQGPGQGWWIIPCD